MVNSQIIQDIQNAKKGNEIARQQIISSYKPYIINIVSHICKRFISWSDEEASVGLLAFNRAIDTYESEKGRNFLNFAYCLIKRDMINHFRRSRNQNCHLSLDYTADEEDEITEVEIEKSMQYYQDKIVSNELVEEILELDNLLGEYGIKFEELENLSPKHRDTREILNRMALDFIKDKELVDELIKKRRFPAAAFVKKSGYNIKSVEKHRKYLITLIIINLHPEWMHLASYAKIK